MSNAGYGKGWREPKARTFVSRIIQKTREPATTTDHVVMLSLFVATVLFLGVVA